MTVQNGPPQSGMWLLVSRLPGSGDLALPDLAPTVPLQLSLQSVLSRSLVPVV